MLLIKVVTSDWDHCAQEQGMHHLLDHGAPAVDSGLESGTCVLHA